MVAVLYILSLVVFCLAFHFIKAMKTTRRIVRIAKDSASVVFDASLDDEEKEREVRKFAWHMLKSGALVSFKAVTCLALAAFPILVVNAAGWITVGEFAQFSLRIDVLVVTLVVGLGLIFSLREKTSRS